MTPEHIEKELKLAQANILAAQERMDAIVKELVESKPAEVEEWPRVGDRYFTPINLGGAISWYNVNIDKVIKKMNLIYPTLEEKEAKASWLANPRTEARFRLEQLEGFSLAGSWAIHCGEEGLYVVLLRIRTGGIRFTTEAHAQYAMTHHAADLMLVLKGEVQS